MFFLFGLVGREPEMHDAVSDDNVLRPDPRCPIFMAEFAEKSGTDRPVVALALARQRTLCRAERANEISSADDADDLAVTRDWDALDPPRFQQCGDITQIGLLGHGHDVLRHDILDRATVRFDVLAGALGSEMVEPPRTAALAMAVRGADFGAVQQVALADDADELAARINYRGAAYAPFREKRRQVPNGCARIDRNNIGCHHVHCAHRIPPCCSIHGRFPDSRFIGHNIPSDRRAAAMKFAPAPCPRDWLLCAAMR